MIPAFSRKAGIASGNVVEAHQIRWRCGNCMALPAPEGAHQDGFDRIAMFMVESANITGGEVLVYPEIDAAPLVLEANADPGHWDLIVLTANR